MIVYKIDNKIYINLTNRCSNSCDFCVRSTSDAYKDYSLWLNREPTEEEVIEELKNYLTYDEFVFCGYGEPLYRTDAIITIAKFLKENGKKTRINTNGQASLIVGEGVAERFKGVIDVVSISLNATDAKEYQKICHSIFGEEAFNSLLDFAKECKEAGIRVKMSIVDCIGKENIAKCQAIADKIGVELRVRQLIV